MDSQAQSADRAELLNFEVRVIVAGSRKYNNYEEFASIMDDFVMLTEMRYPDEPIAFITGEAEEGPDHMVKRWCGERKRPWFGYPAKWDDLTAKGAVIKKRPSDGKEYNVLAGFARNTEMAEVGTDLIVFWDGKTKGSAHMHDTALEKELNVMSVLIKLDEGSTHGGKAKRS